MSNSILGENRQPLLFVTEYEVCVDEENDEYDYLDGEFVETNNIWGYRAVCPKNSQTTTVTIKYYYHAPTSEWYWTYNYDEGYSPIIPLVYICDDNWNLDYCLNENMYEYSLAGKADGWISLNVTLKRKLAKDEKIFFGVYSDLLGVSVMWESDLDTTMCYFYFSTERRRYYNSPIEYITSSAFKNKCRGLSLDYEACIYLEYENEIESVAYTRTVLGNVGAATANTRKLVWKRTVPTTGNLTALFTRKSDWIRNAASSGNLSAGAYRFNHLFRAASDSKRLSDSYDKRIFFFRRHEEQGEITAKSYRSNRMKIDNSDGFSFSDSLQQLLLIIRSVFSDNSALDNLSHIADYKRSPESVVDDEEMVIRYGDNFRSFTDEVDFEALPFASRLFFRTVQTVMSFWDWMRGKIREANNVASFYCPIWTEIELECRI